MRRRAVLGSALALGAAVAVRPTAAQEATPSADEGPSWLFVQRFASASLAPDPATPGRYELALSGLDPAVLAFTDRPDRLVATVPTAAFVGMVGAAAADPLNATLVAAPAGGGGEVSAVVVLDGVAHDAAAGTVAFRVAVLAEAEGPLPAAPLAPSPEARGLGVGHLFVDATSGDMADTVSADHQAGGKAVVAPAYAAGAIAEARSIHKARRQHDNPTARPKRR